MTPREAYASWIARVPLPKNDRAKVLSLAAYLIDKVGWTQGVSVRDKCGFSEPFQSNNAVSFCAIGATQAAAFLLGCESGLALAVLRDSVPGHRIHEWNDKPQRIKQQVVKHLLKLADSL